MAAKKKIKKVTYAEFLSWLEGVESMQEENWTPSSAQWKTIREKLNTVKPDVQPAKTQAVQTEPVGQFIPQQQPLQSTFDQPSQPTQPSPPPMQLSHHQTGQRTAEGVPAPNMGPYVDAQGNPLSENEFL